MEWGLVGVRSLNINFHRDNAWPVLELTKSISECYCLKLNNHVAKILLKLSSLMAFILVWYHPDYKLKIFKIL